MNATTIVDCRWTPQVNILVLKCPCGMRYDQRADRWVTVCPWCTHRDDLFHVRQRIELDRENRQA